MARFKMDFDFPDYVDVNKVFDPCAEDNTDYENLDEYYYKNLEEKGREETGAFESIPKHLDNLKEREDEKRAFESIPKHGVHAHAFKRGLDNLKMKKLREEGLNYRTIAKLLGCSPNTVRNRLKKLEAG